MVILQRGRSDSHDRRSPQETGLTLRLHHSSVPPAPHNMLGERRSKPERHIYQGLVGSDRRLESITRQDYQASSEDIVHLRRFQESCRPERTRRKRPRPPAVSALLAARSGPVSTLAPARQPKKQQPAALVSVPTRMEGRRQGRGRMKKKRDRDGDGENKKRSGGGKKQKRGCGERRIHRKSRASLRT